MVHQKKFTPFLLLLALFCGSVLAAQSAPQAAKGRFFLIYTEDLAKNVWWESSTVVDPLGGVHSAFYTAEKLYYAYCAANCDDPGQWWAVPLATLGTYSSLAHPSLAVNANGRPRLMWYHDDRYKYAECNSNCTSAANWKTVVPPLVEESWYGYPEENRYFALDAQGRPGFVVYESDGFQYTTCASNCTVAANWQSTLLTFNWDQAVKRPQLIYTSSSKPRVMGIAMWQDDSLAYLECNANCTQAANWQWVKLNLDPVGHWGNFAFRLDKQGRPRVAFYSGMGVTPDLQYAWSNGNPLVAGSWSSYGLPYEPADERTLDLAFTSDNRPAVAYGSAELDLHYAECTADCETSYPVWQDMDVETSEELNASDPVPPSPGCVVSTWMLGEYPSLALDAADTPYISYYARSAQYCQGSIVNHVWAVRLAHGWGTTLDNYKVFLPFVVD